MYIGTYKKKLVSVFDYINFYWQEDDHGSCGQINHSIGRTTF